jgi:hypothetical protein
MKSFFILLAVFLLFTVAACNESVKTTLKLNESITTTGSGMMVALLDGESGPLRLKGNLELIEGTYKLYLTDPNSDTIYFKSYDAFANVKIDTTFQPVEGEWTFSYKILKLGDLAPSGSFDFSIIF